MAYTSTSYWDSITNWNVNVEAYATQNPGNQMIRDHYDPNSKNSDLDTWYGIDPTSGNDRYYAYQEIDDGNHDNPNLTDSLGSGDDFLDFDFILYSGLVELDITMDMGNGDDAISIISIEEGDGAGRLNTYLTMGNGEDYVYLNINSSNSHSESESIVTLGDGSDYYEAVGEIRVDVSGGDGNDIIITDGEDDTIGGGSGADTISAGGGDDTINGGNGADVIDGGDGEDIINGGNGDDVILGGSINSSGVDYLTGGNGNDLFVVNEWAVSTTSTDAWADWGTWRSVYAGADAASTMGSIAGLSDMPVASLFFNVALYTSANALATWLSEASDSTEVLDATDSTYSQIEDFNMTEDMIVLPVQDNIGYSVFTADDGTERFVEFTYDGQTDTFLKVYFEGEVNGSSATGFYAEFLNAIGVEHDETDQDELANCFYEVMSDSIATIEEDNSGNITITQGGYSTTYTDSELDEYYSTNWSNKLDAGSSIMLLGADIGYMSVFTADNHKYISGGNGHDAFYGVKGADARAYIATFDGDDLYNHKDNDYGFYFNGGDGTDTVSFDSYEGSSGVTIDLSNEVQTSFGSTNSEDDEDEDITLIDVENLIGTDEDDTLTGNNDDNILMGGEGDDHLEGGKGDDVLYGGEDDDTAYYADVLDNYDINVWEEGGSTWMTIEDVGSDGTNEGFDTLSDIEYVVFDGTQYSALELAAA